MDNEIRVEHYLLQLDRFLRPLPVGQRAEIVTEVKAQIRAAIEKDPTQSIEHILKDLGPASQLASSYLSAKGIKSKRQPARTGKVFKWLAVGTVTFFGLIFCAGLLVSWYFSPLMKKDPVTGDIKLLGGWVSLNDDIGQIKVGDVVLNDLDGDNTTVEGSQTIPLGEIKKIMIPFNTAKLVIVASVDGSLKWSCNVASTRSPQVNVNAGILTLNLDVLSIAKCQISLPKGMQTEMRGVNGHMDVESPKNDLLIALDNGRVKIHTDPATNYDFDVKVKNGLQDIFPRSHAKNAYKVKVNVVNGVIKKAE